MAEMRMTMMVVRVLTAMLNATNERTYGYDLMKQAEVSSGTLYPLLARLEANNLVCSDWEDAQPDELGRGRRRYYILTSNGRSIAKNEYRKLQSLANLGGLNYV